MNVSKSAEDEERTLDSVSRDLVKAERELMNLYEGRSFYRRFIKSCLYTYELPSGAPFLKCAGLGDLCRVMQYINFIDTLTKQYNALIPGDAQWESRLNFIYSEDGQMLKCNDISELHQRANVFLFGCLPVSRYKQVMKERGYLSLRKMLSSLGVDEELLVEGDYAHNFRVSAIGVIALLASPREVIDGMMRIRDLIKLGIVKSEDIMLFEPGVDTECNVKTSIIDVISMRWLFKSVNDENTEEYEFLRDVAMLMTQKLENSSWIVSQ